MKLTEKGEVRSVMDVDKGIMDRLGGYHHVAFGRPYLS